MEPTRFPVTDNQHYELFRQLERLKETMDEHIKTCNTRLKELEQSLDQKNVEFLEYKQAAARIQIQFEQMERGILHEFRISQEIMKAMIEHDMGIERTRLEFQLKLEEKEKSLIEDQQRANLMNEQERRAMRISIYKRIGMVVAPITAAATAGIIKIIEKFFM